MAGALASACGCPTASELLSQWAGLVGAARPDYRVALFLRESEGWTLVAPTPPSAEALSIGNEDLDRAASQQKALLVGAARPSWAKAALASFAAHGAWRGVLALWRDRGGLSEAERAEAETIAVAIGQTLMALRRSETSREEAVAEERERLAAELHDGFLSTLRSTWLHVQVAIKEARHDPEKARAWLGRTEELLGTTNVEARRFLLGLRKLPEADEFGSWLQDFTSDFAKENGISVALKVSGKNRLTRAQAYEATRLVRQALGNVGDHAKARNASVVVLFGKDVTTISVADDGVGFDVESTLRRALDSSRNGIRGMRYRVESIGGEMRIKSRPGEGATVIFRLRHLGPHGQGVPAGPGGEPA